MQSLAFTTEMCLQLQEGLTPHHCLTAIMVNLLKRKHKNTCCIRWAFSRETTGFNVQLVAYFLSSKTLTSTSPLTCAPEGISAKRKQCNNANDTLCASKISGIILLLD